MAQSDDPPTAKPRHARRPAQSNRASPRSPQTAKDTTAGGIAVPIHFSHQTIALLLACAIVGFVMYIVVNPGVGRDELSVPLVRGLLSTAIGVLGGYFAGWIKVESKALGLAIQGAGGVALAVITYLFGPGAPNGIAPAFPKAEAKAPTFVDFRSSKNPYVAVADYPTGRPLLSMPLQVSNLAGNSRDLVWEGVDATLMLNGEALPYRGQYVVIHVEGDLAPNWLGRDPAPFAAVSVKSDAPVTRNVMFWPAGSSGPSWQQFVDTLLATPELFEVRLKLTVSGEAKGPRTIDLSCVPDLASEVQPTRKFITEKKRIPGRLGLNCHPKSVSP